MTPPRAAALRDQLLAATLIFALAFAGLPRTSASAPIRDTFRFAFTADSVWILRCVPDSTRPGPPRWRAASRSLAAPADARRLADLLGSLELNPDRTSPRRCEGCSGRLELAVQFGHAQGALDVQLVFPERVAFFSTPDGFSGSAFFDSLAPAIIEVARRLLAADSTMARYALPPASWGGAQSPGLARLAPTRETMPEAVKRVAPRYPEDARNARIQGTVMVQALVGRDGEVKEVRIRESIPMLDEAALDAVRKWRFKPATADGEPRAVWVSIPVKFTLH